MAKSKKEIVIQLSVDGKDFDAKIKNSDQLISAIRKNAVSAGDSMAKWSTIVTGFNQGLQLAKSIASSLSGLVDIYAKQERAERKVEQAVKQTGQAAGFTADELKRVASGLQEITTFGDEQILNEVTAQMLTFTNITGENFLKAQRSALDLATVLDGDLKSASIMLGKALNDPVQGLNAMRRVGVAFSDDQQAMIKNLVEQNDLLGAQAVILEEVNRQYGGQAEAVADTLTGKITQAQNKIGDSMEQIGKMAAVIAAPISGIMAGALEGVVNLFLPMDKLSEKLSEQKVEFNSLMGVLQDAETSYETKQMVIDVLNRKYKDYVGNLNLEKATMEELLEVQKNSNAEFEKKIKLAIAQETLAEYDEKVKEYQRMIMNLEVDLQKLEERGTRGKEVTFGKEMRTKTIGETTESVIAATKEELDKATKDRQEYLTILEKINKDIFDALFAPMGTGGKVPESGGGGEKPEKAAKEDMPEWLRMRLEEIEMMQSIDEISEELWVMDQERLTKMNELKTGYFDEEMLRLQEQQFAEQLLFDSSVSLTQRLIDEETRKKNLITQMENALTEDDFKRLEKEKKVTENRIKLIKSEQEARRIATLQMMESGAQAYNAEESFGRNLNRLINNKIRGYIADAVMNQVSKAISFIPFPFNIFAAPAAGLAIQAIMERMIPKFAKGVKDFEGGMALVGEQGPELVSLPVGSSVYSNRDTVEMLEALANARGYSGGSSVGMEGVVAAIVNLGDRFESIERRVYIDENSFDNGLKNYSNRNTRIMS